MEVIEYLVCLDDETQEETTYEIHAAYAYSATKATNATNATNATTAAKLSTSAGSVTQPVYFSNGVPTPALAFSYSNGVLNITT